MNTAAKVAKEKEQHPERFCPTPKCLWRTGGGYCPRHDVTRRDDFAPRASDGEWLADMDQAHYDRD